jgi:hypothetical protein
MKKGVVFVLYLLLTISSMLVVSLISQSSAENPSVLSQWRARAVIARENIANSESKNCGCLKCKYCCALEHAYLPYCDNSTCAHLIKKSAGTETYKLSIACGGTSEADTFDISYIYNSSTKKLITHRVDKLPRDWMLMAYTNGSRLLALVDNRGNSYAINLNDPTAAYVAMTAADDHH